MPMLWLNIFCELSVGIVTNIILLGKRLTRGKGERMETSTGRYAAFLRSS